MNKFTKYKKNSQNKVITSLIGLSFAFSQMTDAASQIMYESSNDIKNTAKTFLEEMTSSADIEDRELSVGNLDPRLKLRKCEQPLIAYLPQGSRQNGKMNIGVKCLSPVSWKVFLSATNYEYQTVVVAKNTLRKGQIIGRHDLGTKRVKISQRNKQPIIDFSEVLMTSPRRFIRAGAIIYSNSICMVCRGQKVNVSTGNNFFTINVEAEALADASVGETVRLRNQNSRRIFDGKVVGRNRAQVFLLK